MATQSSTGQQDNAEIATTLGTDTFHHQKALLEYEGTDGEPVRVSAANPFPVLDASPLDFFQRVVENNVPGYGAVNKFGSLPDLDSGDGSIAVWGGTKGPYLGHNAVAAQAFECSSSSAADAGTVLSTGTATGGSANTIIDTAATFSTDGVAVDDIVLNDSNVAHGIIIGVTETTLTVHRMNTGVANDSGDTYRIVTPASTGCPVVLLTLLLDGNFAEIPGEYVVLTGVTGADSTATGLRCSRVKCVAPDGLDNAGTITVRQTTTTANIFAVIGIGDNQSQIAVYTVPAGKTGWIYSVNMSLSKKTSATCNVNFMSREVGEVFRITEELNVASTGSSFVQRRFPLPKGPFSEMADLTTLASTDGTNTSLSASFCILLVDN